MYSILEVPFHMGLEEVAAGKGPGLLVRAGADRVLETRGIPASVSHVRLRDSTTSGLDAVVDVNRQISLAVREAREQGVLPVVLAGNCNSCLGTIAGCDDVERLGIVWLDAHPDFHTPQTSISGSLEGMALAAAVGHCHSELRERIGLERAVSEQDVVLAGVYDIEPGERGRLEDSWISVHPSDSVGLLPVALEQLASRVDAVYLHVDVDVTGGMETPAVVQLIRLVRATLPVAAVALTNYNPDLDTDGRAGAAALELLAALKPGESIQ